MKTMYPGIPFSPPTTLTANVGAADTVITVADASALPDAPNYAAIGTDESGEVILYAAKAGNTLSGCTRGVEGTAQSWNAETPIGRNWTNRDYQTLIDNIGEMDEAVDSLRESVEAAEETVMTLGESVSALGQTVSAHGEALTTLDESVANLDEAKAIRAASPTAGNLAALDAQGNPVDSGIAQGTVQDLVSLRFENVTVQASLFEKFTSDGVEDDEETKLINMGYEYRAKLALTGVLETMLPYITLSLYDIQQSNVDLVNQFRCYDGGVCLYADGIPVENITALTMEFKKAVV